VTVKPKRGSSYARRALKVAYFAPRYSRRASKTVWACGRKSVCVGEKLSKPVVRNSSPLCVVGFIWTEQSAGAW
jgi:hypothetical protein